MFDYSVLVHWSLFLLYLLLACPYLFLSFTGVRFRKFFSLMAYTVLSNRAVLLMVTLLNCWPRDASFTSASSVIASLTTIGACASLGFGLSILLSRVPEVPVYIMGVLSADFAFQLFACNLSDMPFLALPMRAVVGALGAASVYFFEPYAILVGTAVFGSVVACNMVLYGYHCYVMLYKPADMVLALKQNMLLSVFELVLVASAIGAQFWLGNHRRTYKQVQDQRAVKDLENAPAPTSAPPMQLGYSKKDFV